MTADPPRIALRTRRFIAFAAIVAVGTSVVGSALVPYLLTHAPVVLLALAPEPRHVVLATPLLPGEVIIPVTVARRVAGLTALYFLGWAYGERAIRFVEGRSGRMGRMLRWLQRTLARFGSWVVLVFPMPTVCTLAGVGSVRFSRVLLAMTVGQCFWVSLTWVFGDLAAPIVRPILAFLAAHVAEATLVCVAVVGLWQIVELVRRRRRADDADESPPPEVPEED